MTTLISVSELQAIFGDTMPMEAVVLLADPGNLTIVEVRKELHRIAGKDTKQTVWAAGWNIPGYLPDDDVGHFATWEEAHTYLSEELRHAADQEHTSGNGPAAVWYDGTRCILDQSEPDDRFCERVGNYVWWIEQVTLPVEEINL